MKTKGTRQTLRGTKTWGKRVQNEATRERKRRKETTEVSEGGKEEEGGKREEQGKK